MLRTVALSPAVTTLDVLGAALDWIEAHPTVFGYLLALLTWASGTVLVWLKKPTTAEGYAALSTKNAAFWKAVATVFGDPAKLRQALNEYKHGYVPRAERVTLPDGLPAVQPKENDHV